MIAKVSVLKSFAILAKNVYNGNHFYLIINHMKQDSSFHIFLDYHQPKKNFGTNIKNYSEAC